MEILHTRRGRIFSGLVLILSVIVLVVLLYAPLKRVHAVEMNGATVHVQIDRAFLLYPQSVCFSTFWNFDAISGVYYNGNGVPAPATGEHCIDPDNLQAAYWQVIFQDGSSQYFLLMPTILTNTVAFYVVVAMLGALAFLTFGPIIPVGSTSISEQRSRRDFLRLGGILVLGTTVFGFVWWRKEDVVVCNRWVLHSDEVRSDICQ